MMSPSSSARQTPTATASCPIATWRKPGSSPARNRSSTFSSKRRISSISRKHSRRSSRESARVSSTLAITSSLGKADRAGAPMLPGVALVEQWNEIEQALAEDWDDARLALKVADDRQAERAAALLAPVNPGHHGRELRFYTARHGAGP